MEDGVYSAELSNVPLFGSPDNYVDVSGKQMGVCGVLLS